VIRKTVYMGCVSDDVVLENEGLGNEISCCDIGVSADAQTIG